MWPQSKQALKLLTVEARDWEVIARMPELRYLRICNMVQLRSQGSVKGLIDDGHSWRKYGQKDILGAKHPRAYYRCAHRNTQGCGATKQVQRSDEDLLLFNIIYHGEHTCGQRTVAGLAYDTDRSLKRQRKVMEQKHQVRVSADGSLSPLDDGHSWRKYGQKNIPGAKYPRAYFRCTHRHSQACVATKQVQRSDDDPLLFDVFYHGSHTCVQSTITMQPPEQPH